MNNEINTIYDDIRRKHDSKSSRGSHIAVTAGAVRVSGGSSERLKMDEDEEEPNHPVFYDDENPPKADDELDDLSNDILRKHNSKSSRSTAGAIRVAGSSNNSGGPVLALLNDNDKMQLAMRTSQANLPGAVHHAPGQDPIRAKPTQSSQLTLFARLMRNPKEAHRGPQRHNETEEERMVDCTGASSQLDDLNSSMNIFKRQNDKMEDMEVQQKRRRKLFLLLVVVALLIITVGIVVGVLLRKNSNGQKDEVSPSTTGSAPDTEHNFVDYVEEVADCLTDKNYDVSENFTKIQSIVSEAGMSDVIETPGTPARAALCWIVEVDSSFDFTATEESSAVMQRFALGLIYFHFVLNLDSDSESKLPTSNWLNSSHECEWDYVTCSDEGNDVIGLDMTRLSLGGTMPSEFALLKNLTRLELALNLLDGTIPAEIWTMESLEILDVAQNFLSGPLSSDIRNLPQLRIFIADNNRLSGAIPDLSDLPKLEKLRLAGSSLSGIFPNLQGTTNLESLELISLVLSGAIPSYLGSLTKLTLLAIKNMQFLGSIPTEIGMLTELSVLSIARLTAVSGPIPTELGQLTRLTSLDLEGMHKLSGSVPTEIGQLTKLVTLDLDNTKSLTGTIPFEVCNLRFQGLTELKEFCITSSCETKCPPL